MAQLQVLPKNREELGIKLRYALIGCLVLGFALDNREFVNHQYGLSVILVWLGAAAVLHLLYHQKNYYLYNHLLWALFEIVVISALVYYTGGINSPYYLLFYFTYVFVTLDKGKQAGLIVAAFALLAYGAVYLLALHGSGMSDAGDYGAYLFRLGAMAAFVYFFSAALDKFAPAAQTDGAEAAADNRDALTSLYDRTFFAQQLRQLTAATDEAAAQLSCALIDIDNFDVYNEIFGYGEGDLALQQIAQLIVAQVGQNASVYRYDGDAFVVLLPGTDKMAACVQAEQIREAICHHSHCFRHPLTVSVGIAGYPTDAASADTIVFMAETALYKAKVSGKNCVQVIT